MIFSLSIALAQINPHLGDLGGNTALIVNACAQHKKADLIVFPELSICGYPPEDLVMKPSFVESCREAVMTVAEKTKNLDCGIILGAPWREFDTDKLPYNAAILLHKGRIEAIRYKHELPNYDVFDERRIFSAGPMPEPVPFKDHMLGIMICEDMWKNRAARHLKNAGADVLIIPNGSPYTIGKHAQRLNLARERVSESGLPLYYINQVGGQDELVFDGGSFVMDAGGNLQAQLPFFREEISAQKNESRSGYTDLSHSYEALKLGLGDYVRKNGFSSVLLGLSGGVDSALVAAIASDALGAKNVQAFMLPSPFTSQESLDDAAALAKALKIKLETISIEEPLKAFEQTLPYLKGLPHENIQSRIRGTLLMALSNSTGKMLLSTGNKSEMAVGYATIYGDMNGGFNPIKDVYKTHVYELCRWRNAQSPVIPENILLKAPTAELRDNQKDQDSLPPYDILDGILQGLIEHEMSVDQICQDSRFERETVLKVWKLLDQSEYKRAQSPPGTKITEKAFGRDRRYPMTNGFVKSVG